VKAAEEKKKNKEKHRLKKRSKKSRNAAQNVCKFFEEEAGEGSESESERVEQRAG